MAYGHYEDWQAAAEASAGKKAWAYWGRETDRRGNQVKTEVVKPLSGDPYIRYKGADIPIRRVKAYEINHIRDWRPY